MVFLTGKYSLREASCCSVEVVNGAAGLFLAGFFSNPVTVKFAASWAFKKASAASYESNSCTPFALNTAPLSV